MIGNMIQSFMAQRALRKWFSTPVGVAVKELAQKYFYGESILAGLSEETKNDRIVDLFRIFEAIEKSENQFLAYREQLASQAYAYAKYQVLCLTKDEKKEHPMFQDEKYISGELHKHIKEIADKKEEFQKIKWENDENLSDEDWISICNTRSALYLFYLNALNILRMQLNDYSEKKDWFKPLVRSMCIWAEDTYRSDIGLPSFLPGSLDGLKHSTFFNLVTNGHENPLYEFEKHHPKDFEEEASKEAV
ncbi:MAG TPA: hypothetical protein PLK94_05970 [Alphaproteobacteria bacterium]|nr:hypothetical protein [Alphaproteobacteria bacterium]HOO50820.1 hypothetical protein [Alphaproteobacteria bacterium]